MITAVTSSEGFVSDMKKYGLSPKERYVTGLLTGRMHHPASQYNYTIFEIYLKVDIPVDNAKRPTFVDPSAVYNRMYPT